MSDLQKAYDAIRAARWSPTLLPGHTPEQRAGVAIGLEMAMEIIRGLADEDKASEDRS